ncbi:MAG: hypothetical protein JRN26_01290 [Nitrososphaerota archaeon]|nr:hypothetical protein [Nitrososphaerota archaeon]MDG6943408.1 hypothetical protein [Nitrososphaerota archaeon]
MSYVKSLVNGLISDRWVVKPGYFGDYSLNNTWAQHDLKIISLHKQLLSFLTSNNIEIIDKSIVELQEEKLLIEEDQGYTRAGNYRGTELKLSELGNKTIENTFERNINEISNQIKQLFSDNKVRLVYYLFTKKDMPYTLLHEIESTATEKLLASGFISEENGIFLHFIENEFYKKNVAPSAAPDLIDKFLKEECDKKLTLEERKLIGFLSKDENIIVEKHSTSFYSDSDRISYVDLIVNFPFYKLLFSYLENIPKEEVEKMVSNLEKKGFIVRETREFGKPQRYYDKNFSMTYYPIQAVVCKFPVKFDYELTDNHKAEIRNYIESLAKDMERNYKQLIMLDYASNLYDSRYSGWAINTFWQILGYEPLSDHQPFIGYSGQPLADQTLILYPLFTQEIEDTILKIKASLASEIRKTIQIANSFDPILYDISEAFTDKGYYIITIRGNTPNIRKAFLVIASWLQPLDVEKICHSQGTDSINIIAKYPNLPALKNMLVNYKKCNVAIIKNEELYPAVENNDDITKIIFSTLSQVYKVQKLENEPPESAGLNPKEYFNNIKKVEKVLKSIKENVCIIDKNFKIESLDLFHDYLNFNSIKEIRFLIGSCCVDGKLKREARLFAKQQNEKGINVEFRVAKDTDFKDVHDRYIIDDEKIYDIPPPSDITGKLADIKLLDNARRNEILNVFNAMWSRAISLDKFQKKQEDTMS